ncbi:hypothetical protein ACIQ7S_23835 [Streptomyces griseoluteus]|uniref:hypothetical protein n=1 Tax=Streptomyces griseoluteus TaxID=29306 RepID=UPI003316C7A9
MLETVLGPASEAYYSGRVKSGSEARIRAQAAQSTVTLFASGIVAALTFTQLDDRPLVTRCAGVVAMALWLLSAVLYLRAVAQPVSALTGPSHARDRLDLLNAVLAKADDEAAQVDNRQRQANRVVMVALAATVITVALAALVGPEKETTSGTVVVSPSYVKSIQALCVLRADRITGRVDKASLGTAFLRVTVASGVCGRGDDRQLVVPRAAIRAITMEGE